MTETIETPAARTSALHRFVLPPSGGAPGSATLRRHLTVTVVAVLALIGLTYLLPLFWNYEMATIAAYLCAVAGLTVLTGQSGQVSLGHSALMATGAYTVALVLQWFSDHNVFTQWTLPIALVAGALVTGVLGLVIGLIAARLRGPYLAGITLAVAVVVPGITSEFSSVFNGDQGLGVDLNPPPGSLPNEQWQAWYSIIAAAVVMFLLANLCTGSFGRRMRAIRDDEVAAQLAGVNVARTQVVTFVVSAVAAGLGGGLIAAINQAVSPDTFSLTLSLYLLLAIVVGGLGSLSGAVWGAIVVVVLPYLTSQLMNSFTMSVAETQKLKDNVPLAIFGIALIVIAIAAPSGLAGLFRRIGSALRGRRTRPSVPAQPAPTGNTPPDTTK